MNVLTAIDRLAIEIRGVVQGVGFRPYVYALATQFHLAGFVANRNGAVWIEVEGEVDHLESFCQKLEERPPPLARIESVERHPSSPRGDREFSIEPSFKAGAAPIVVSPDAALCVDCLAELSDPNNRRYGFPFINCTNCGPRLTIVAGAPYDRERTSMSRFPMCDACRAEYQNPSDRRFHAQATCCPVCGPRLRLCSGEGAEIAADDPIRSFAQAIAAGKIGALKGLGGFHLVCDATNEEAVRRLRLRKQRDEKPLAIMVGHLAAVEAICRIAQEEQELLLSPAAPMVLLERSSDPEQRIADLVAPGNPRLGVMLPYTPLHYLLLQIVAPLPLVMTSGNRSDEPIACEDGDAMERLKGIADLFLTHDRPIQIRCDDSIVQVIGAAPSPLRRSRGLAPSPLVLPSICPAPILAVGGQLKGTFALGQDRQAIVSHHLGDLDHLAAYEAFLWDVRLYEELFAISPRVVAHDLHPDYASTRYALSCGLPAVAVQHHHAHLASCLAEHGLKGPAIGVIFDGSGLGTDGHIWGGEFLIGDCGEFRRFAALRNVPLPGGEQAIREPWRMALAHLLDAGCELTQLEKQVQADTLRIARNLIERRIGSPLTSSMGRLFDAVAAISGIRSKVSFEGQAAMELEWRAAASPTASGYDWDLQANEALESATAMPLYAIDTRPLIRAVVRESAQGVSSPIIARRFHATIVEIIRGVCLRARDETGLAEVVLSGGVFSNALLTRETRASLEQESFHVFTHEKVPANDGGLSLGQLAVASRLLTLAESGIGRCV